MTLEQVYILNSAIDGKDVYSLPSISGLDMPGVSVAKHKDSLIKEGLLETHSSFTDEGVKVVKDIRDYKGAKKYITILGMAIGIVDDKKSVALKYSGDGYSFTPVDTKDVVGQVFDVYRFLSLDSAEMAEGIPFEFGEVIQKYRPGRENSFSIKTEGDAGVTHEVFFSDGKGIFVYDFIEKLLRQKSSEGVKKLLSERMVA